jgi:hypothetical protein
VLLGKLRLPMPLRSIPFRVPPPSFLQRPRKQLVITAAVNRIKIATIRRRESLPSWQPQRLKVLASSSATKAAIENPKSPLLEHPEKLDSKAPASPVNEVTELLKVITPALRPAG